MSSFALILHPVLCQQPFQTPSSTVALSATATLFVQNSLRDGWDVWLLTNDTGPYLVTFARVTHAFICKWLY